MAGPLVQAAAADVEVRHPSPDVAMAVSGSGPAARNGPRSFVVVVRNLGRAATTEPVRVALQADSGSGTLRSARGGDWDCDVPERSCRLDRGLDAGETAPALGVTTTSAPTTYGGSSALVATASGGGADPDHDNDRSAAAVPLINGTGVDLVPSVEDAGLAADGDGRGRFLVRIRNVGAVASRGSVAVDLGRSAGVRDDGVVASGDGWSCPSGTGRCTTDATAGADAELPSLTVAVPRSMVSTGSAQTLVARVSGGDDGDERDDEASGTRVPDDAVDGREIATSIRDLQVAGTGGTARFEVATRNVSGAARTTPTTVVIDTDRRGEPVATGAGWTCTTELRCRTTDAVSAGAELPRITVRWRPTAAGAEESNPYRRPRFSVAPSGVDPVTRYGESTTDFPIARTGADLVATVDGARPVIGRETAVLRTRVRNAGTATARGRVTVELAAGEQYSDDSSGTGWSCDGRHCSHEGPVGADDELPPITTLQRIPVHGDEFSRYAGARLTATEDLADVDRRNDEIYADAETAPAPADLTPVIDDVRAATDGRPASARVVVRNVGTAATDGTVVVHGAATMEGDGWTCGKACRHPGPVAAGGRLPELRVTLPEPGDADDRGFPAVTGAIDVEVENRSDGFGVNDGATALVPTSPVRPLRLVVDPPRSVSPDGVVRITGRIALRSALATPPVRLRVVPAPGVSAQALSLSGAVACASPTTCDSRVAPEAWTPLGFTAVVRLADGVQAGEVHLEASTADAGTEVERADARVLRAVDRPDVALQLEGVQPPAAPGRGATAVATVRNGGGATDAPVVVTFPRQSYGSAASAAGPDWGCEARETNVVRCRYDRPVAALSTLPPITVRTGLHDPGGGELTGTATVAGDAASENDGASLDIVLPETFGSGLLTALDPTDPSGDDVGAWDVLVRNGDDEPTTKPVVVTAGLIEVPGYPPQTVSGPGWSCGPGGCRRDEGLGPGETAPPLHVTAQAPTPGDVSPFSPWRTSVSARTLDGRASSVGAVLAPSSYADLRTSVNGRQDDDGAAVVNVDVANLGSAATPGEIQVQVFSTFDGNVLRGGSGDGWVCPRGGSACRLSRALGPGERAPTLALLPPTGSEPDGALSSVEVTAVDPGGRIRARTSGSARVPIATPTTAADLVVGLDVPRPFPTGTTSPAAATVRNAGVLPFPGDVTLDLSWTGGTAPAGATFAGDGWSCTGYDSRPTCSHPGPVLGGETLPPVTASLTAGPSYAFGVTDLAASVNAFRESDPRPGNNSASATFGVGGGPGRLATTIRGARPYLAGDPVELSTEVRNVGFAAVQGPVELRVVKSPTGAVVAGPGWACVGLVCRHPGPVPLAGALPPVVLRATAPVRGQVDVEATATAPGFGGDPLNASGRVSTSPPPRFADLVPTWSIADPAVPGRDWVVLLHERNTGTRGVRGTTTVELDGGDGQGTGVDAGPVALPAGTTAGGDGWTCVGVRCSTDADVPAGGALPDLGVAVPLPTAAGRPTLRARSTTSDPGAGTPETVAISSGATAATAGPADLRSRLFSVGTASNRARPGERIAVQVPIDGLEPFADRDATLTVDLPGALRFDGAGAGQPAPDVDGGRLRWGLRIPADGDDRLLSFWAVMSPNASEGGKALAGEVVVDGQATPERHRSDVAVVDPRLDPAETVAVAGDQTTSVDVTGDLLRVEDRYELVRGDEVLGGRDADGDDRRMRVQFDPRSAKAGTYDLVVRTTTGVVLRRADAVRIERDTPEPTEGGSAGGHGSTTPTGGSTGGASSSGGVVRPSTVGGPDPTIAALLAALATGTPPRSATTPTGTPTATPPSGVRFVGAAPSPAVPALVRSGWRLRVRTSALSAVRVDLLADRSTARRLGVRTGTVLARAPLVGKRRAGTVAVVVRVPSALRARVARSTRLTGTLRLRATSVGGTTTVTRRVTLRR